MRLLLIRTAAFRRPLSRRGRLGLLAIAVAVLVAALAPPAAAAQHQAPPRLRVVDLGTLAGDCCSQANAINDRGEVVGYSGSRRSATVRAFRWRDGRMVDLGTLGGGLGSTATDINNHGDIVGASHLANGFARATLWRDGRVIDLGTLGGPYSYATAVNDAGEVVGYSAVAPGSFDLHAFSWRRGVMTDLGVLSAYDINNRSQVVGDSAAGGMNTVPVRWQRGTVQSLTTRSGRATAVNDRGQVIGYFFDGHGSFLWSAGRVTDIGTPPGAASVRALGINNRGDVVGDAGLGAFLWRQGQMTVLPRLAGSLTIATAINNRGQIVGHSSISPDGTRSHAVLWTY